MTIFRKEALKNALSRNVDLTPTINCKISEIYGNNVFGIIGIFFPLGKLP